jgi:hypothetical protein
MYFASARAISLSVAQIPMPRKKLETPARNSEIAGSQLC